MCVGTAHAVFKCCRILMSRRLCCASTSCFPRVPKDPTTSLTGHGASSMPRNDSSTGRILITPGTSNGRGPSSSPNGYPPRAAERNSGRRHLFKRSTNSSVSPRLYSTSCTSQSVTPLSMKLRATLPSLSHNWRSRPDTSLCALPPRLPGRSLNDS